LVKPILVKAEFTSAICVNPNVVDVVISIEKLINHVPVTGILNEARPFPLTKLPVVHPVDGEFTIYPIWPEEEGAEPNGPTLYDKC
jgi:hypothetical protein